MTSDHARKRAIRARMAATGEPYSVAARALDAAEAAAAEPIAAEPPAAAPAAAQPAAAEPASPSDGALTEVIACASRTLTAPSARIQIVDHTDLGRDPEPVPRRRRGLIGRLADRAASGILGRVAPEMDPAEVRERFLHQYGAGFIEPAAGRYLIDFGGYAQMLLDGRRFGGRSGEPLDPRHEMRPHRFRRDDPLDALGKLQRATAARWTGEETVRWTRCRVAATTAGPDELTVWIDGERVQRFQTVHHGSGRYGEVTRTETTELWDYGAAVDELDWTRLPTFRTAR